MRPDASGGDKQRDPVVATAVIVQRAQKHAAMEWRESRYDLPLPRGPLSAKNGYMLTESPFWNAANQDRSSTVPRSLFITSMASLRICSVFMSVNSFCFSKPA